MARMRRLAMIAVTFVDDNSASEPNMTDGLISKVTDGEGYVTEEYLTHYIREAFEDKMDDIELIECVLLQNQGTEP